MADDLLSRLYRIKAELTKAQENVAQLIESAKGGGAEEPRHPEQQRAENGVGPLNIIDEEADKCCRDSFARRNKTPEEWEQSAAMGVMTCRDCGTRFEPEMVVRHWRIRPVFAILKPR